MDNSEKLKLIEEAQRYLLKNPSDYLHDITHHQRVLNIALDVLENVPERSEINRDLVELMCWWHDVKIPNLDSGDRRAAEVTAEYLAEQVPWEDSEIVRDGIRNHEFGSSPKYLEGKVLQDADKLEILSAERLLAFKERLELGNANENNLIDRVKEVMNDWLPKMQDFYNFDYSKQEHMKRLEMVKPIIDDIRKLLS